jgi:ABC-type sugar transport system permease subunit
VAPALLLAAFVQVAPALYSLYGSLRDIRFFADRGFVGLAHFEDLLFDPDTHEALARSLVFTAASLIVAMTLALAVALIVRRMGSRGTLLATLVLVPWAMSPIAVSIIWKWILAPFGGGLLATLLASIGWEPVSLLADPLSSMAVLVATSVWRNFAFAALVLAAGLSQIPDELYRASAVDGAGAVQQFRKVTLPLLMPSILIAVVVLTISYFNEVQMIIGLTGGGPVMATTTLSYELFRTGFIEFDQGKANAIGIMMFVINALLLFAFIRLAGRRAGRPL